MKFQYFINANKSIVMVISIKEYESIKPRLKEFYTEEQIKDIDEYGKFKPSSDKFLLCNPHKIKEIITPMMYLNAVTFVDRVPFKEVEF